MSDQAIFSLTAVFPQENATAFLAEKNAALTALWRYWSKVNHVLLNVTICDTEPQTDVDYAGFLYQMDLVRSQEEKVKKLQTDMAHFLSETQLTSLPYQKFLDLISMFDGVAKMVIGNLFIVVETYAKSHGHSVYPMPTEWEKENGYVNPTFEEEDKKYFKEQEEKENVASQVPDKNVTQ